MVPVCEAMDILIPREGIAMSIEFPDKRPRLRNRIQMTGKLGAVIGKQILGRPALGDQAIENLDDMLAAQTLADFDGETFAAEHVNDRESSELLPVAELVRDEVQAPGLVHTLRPAPCLAMDQHLAPLRLFAA